jgi:transposase-like protein
MASQDVNELKEVLMKKKISIQNEYVNDAKPRVLIKCPACKDIEFNVAYNNHTSNMEYRCIRCGQTFEINQVTAVRKLD